VTTKTTPRYPELSETRFGFIYGNAVVERMLSDDKLGVVIRVSSAKDAQCYVDVRVSPAGRKVEVC
jgi:hypothetical protein